MMTATTAKGCASGPCAPAALETACQSGTPTSGWRRVTEFANRYDRVVLVTVSGLVILLTIVPSQAFESILFIGAAMLNIAPWLALSVLVAAGAKASGADALIAHAFKGREPRAIVIATLFGALSPFCSCGVIPVVAALLSAGVPLAPVMAFWLASPTMDPEIFILTAAALGVEFAVAKTLAAIAIALIGGFGTAALVRTGVLGKILRDTVRSGCTAEQPLSSSPVWRFWDDPGRARIFVMDSGKVAWFLIRWLTLAFLVESLMVAYLPASLVATWLGGDGLTAIPVAVALGVPAYLNGYAAIPLIAGLIGLGMNPAVGLSFMLAGGVTSIPAAIAVWALARPRVFLA